MRALLLRMTLVITAAVSLALVAAGGAQAVVVDMNASGTSVPFDSGSQAGYYGVALDPVQDNDLAAAGHPDGHEQRACQDPSLPSGPGHVAALEPRSAGTAAP